MPHNVAYGHNGFSSLPMINTGGPTSPGMSSGGIPSPGLVNSPPPPSLQVQNVDVFVFLPQTSKKQTNVLWSVQKLTVKEEIS
jgi:hypothetical protein